MAVTVETLDKLERKITLTLPVGAIQSEVDSRLKKLARTVKMDGFRPGKVPTALVALGVSLAAYSLRGSWGGMFMLIGVKMIAMPLFVFLIARYAVTLPPLWIKVAVLFAAMPTGANAFLFAQKNDEAVPAVTGAVALGTGFAAVTASVLLWLSKSLLFPMIRSDPAIWS